MNQDEIQNSLDNGDHLGLVLYATELTSGPRLKRLIEICKKSPDDTTHHSWHYLQENPSYVREQKIIPIKPYKLSLLTISDLATWEPSLFALAYYKLSLLTISDAPQLMDIVDIYFPKLNEVDLFLQQFNKKLTTLHKLSDTESSL